MNKLWTSDKTQLNVRTLSAMLMTKFNSNNTCAEFYSFLNFFVLVSNNYKIINLLNSMVYLLQRFFEACPPVLLKRYWRY